MSLYGMEECGRIRGVCGHPCLDGFVDPYAYAMSREYLDELEGCVCFAYIGACGGDKEWTHLKFLLFSV